MIVKEEKQPQTHPQHIHFIGSLSKKMKNVLIYIITINICLLSLSSCEKESDTKLIETSPVDIAQIQDINKADSGYLFKATPGSDVTLPLQAALNHYKTVYIDTNYIISESLKIQSGGIFSGIRTATLKASANRRGLLNSRGTYIDISNRDSSKVSGIKFQPASNMLNLAGWGNTVILIDNSSYCIIENNNFDFSFSYSEGMEAVWITGSNSRHNIVANNYIKTLGLTYCENGASYNTVDKNQLINAHSNALGGIGNGTSPCIGNRVTNNHIENAGRMGIEDQQNTTGTLIDGNIIQGTGRLPGIGTGLGMGISVVARNSMVKNNKVTNAKDYYIEVGGNNNIEVLNNAIYDTGSHKGIFLNFVASSSINKSTRIIGNTIEGCLTSIETFGDGMPQAVIIDNNTIVEPISSGININIGGSINSSVLISGNNITYHKKTNHGSRYGILTYSSIPNGNQKATLKLDKNQITYNTTSVGGSGYDISLIIQIDKTIVSNNIINGYSGGKNYGISTNGSKPINVAFSGNQVKNAIWNPDEFAN